jgi:hypothetical protein
MTNWILSSRIEVGSGRQSRGRWLPLGPSSPTNLRRAAGCNAFRTGPVIVALSMHPRAGG